MAAKKKGKDKFSKEDKKTLITLIFTYQNGDVSVFDSIYNLLKRYLTPIALYMATHHAVANAEVQVTDYALAEEMVEITIIKLWKKMQTGLRNPKAICTYSYQTLHNEFVNQYRKRAREVFPSQFGNKQEEEQYFSKPGIDLQEETEHREQLGQVQSALNELSPVQQEAVILYYYEGYKEKEIADIQNVPVGTVKSRKKNGLNNIRGKIA